MQKSLIPLIPLTLATALCGCMPPATMSANVHLRAPAPPLASASVTLSFFGVPLEGTQDVVFVLDRSGSMGGTSVGASAQRAGLNDAGALFTGLAMDIGNAAAGSPMPSKMEVARAELVQALERLPEGTRFNVVFFESEVAAFSDTMMTMSPAVRHQVISFVQGIEPDGSTAAVPALRVAYGMGARQVIFLSDGLANSGGAGDVVLDEARVAMRSGIRIDTVGLGWAQDDTLLRTMAQESGGISVIR